MGLNKNPFARYQIIDRELRRSKWVKTRELRRIIGNELEPVTPRQINHDVNAMRDDHKLGYYAPIEYNNSEKAYCYSDANYTIQAFGLKDGDINALKFYANTLNQYREYEVFKDFSSAIQKVLDAVKIRSGIDQLDQARNVVQTEYSPPLTGSSMIPIIVQALNENRVIRFEYGKFDEDESKTVDLEPHLLKEDRHRWYVVGKLKKYPDPTTTYALDRMSNLTLTSDTFQPTAFDFRRYYEHSFGITVNNSPPVEVVLSFTPFQGNYIKTLKIHHSQHIIEDSDDELRVGVFVIPSWEFFERILGFGDSVRIISPDSVIEEYKKKILRISSFYEK